MKHLFTLFIALLFISSANAQSDITIYTSSDNGATYSEYTPDLLNILAGSTIYLKVSIAEPAENNSYFEWGDDKTFNLSTDADNLGGSITFNSSSGISNETLIGGGATYLNYSLNITQTPIIRNTITFEGLVITIPSSISGQTDYTLTLTHNLTGDEETETLLTLSYTKPVITIDAPETLGCINTTANCLVKVTPDDLEYVLYIDDANQMQNGNDVTITGSDYINFNYGEEITLKDENNNHATYGISNTVLIDKTYFESIVLGMSPGAVCKGSPITLTLTNTDCIPNSYSYKLFYNLTTELTADVSSSFQCTPPNNGTLQVKIYDADENIVMSSNILTVDNILTLTNTFALADVRLSATVESFNMINQLSPYNNNFTYSIEEIIPVTGYASDLEYFKYTETGNDDYEFGRFVFEYDAENKNAYSQFNTQNPNVTAGEGQGNKVTFYYGRYFKEENHFCTMKTESEVIVIRNDIFVPAESFCSYDDQDYTVEIQTNTDPDINIILEDQRKEVRYKGYKIKYLNEPDPSDIIEASTLVINPKGLFTSNAVTTVEITAFSEVEIFDTQTSNCPPLWDPTINNGGLPTESDYLVGEEVVYSGSLYRCMKYHTISTPGVNADWSYQRTCLIKDLYYVTKAVPINGDITITNTCLDEELWAAPLLSPIYFVGNLVSYNGKKYKCIRNAYKSHRPDLYVGSYWEDQLACGGGDELLSTFDFEFASAVFYIFKPKDNGEILNLNPTYCPSKDSILIESNYNINSVTGNGISVNTFNNTDYYYYSYGKAFNNGTTDNLILNYTDDNGCINTSTYETVIDPEFAVDKTGSIFWNDNNVFKSFDNTFCFNAFDYQLATSNNFTIDDIIGEGVDSTDNIYYFNPYNIPDGTTTTQLELQYTDKATGCPYTYTHPVNLSADFVNDFSELLIKEDYCPIDSAFELTTTTSHGIDSIKGYGINNIYSLEYNPYTAFTQGGSLNYTQSDITDNVSIYFYDEKNCRYRKDYPVNVSINHSVDKSGILFWDKDDVLNPLDNEFCLDSFEFQLATENLFTIDNIVSSGIIESPVGVYNFNPKRANKTDNFIHLYYTDNATGCPYYFDHPIDFSANYVNDISGLLIEEDYCPIDNPFKLNTTNNHNIDSITGLGINDIYSLKYNPYTAFTQGGSFNYTQSDITDNVSIYFYDEKNCRYRKDYPVTVSINYSVDKTGKLFWNKDNVLNPLNNEFCLDDYEFLLATNNNFSIDSILSTGVIESPIDEYNFNPERANKTDNFIHLYYTDNATGCPYYYDHPIDFSASYVNNTSELLFLNPTYCVINNPFNIKTTQSHLIDSISGEGINGTLMGGYYENLTYNPFTAVTANNGSIYNYSASPFVDNISIQFRDEKNCRYTKDYPVTISGSDAESTGGLANIELEYCKYDDRIELISNYTIDSIVAMGVYQEAFTNKWILDPEHTDYISSLQNQNTLLKYYYKDGNNCAWYKDYNFDMYARPYAGFDFSDICFGDYTAFTDTSIFEATGSIDYWEWDFGNGLNMVNQAGVTLIPANTHNGQTIGTYSKPQHNYSNHGIYPISMTVTTNNGCAHSVTDTVIIGDYPVVDFNFVNLINGNPTNFTNITTNPDYDPVVNYIWNFDDTTSVNDTFSNVLTPTIDYTFARNGVHDVNLQAISNNNCISDSSIKVPIFPFIEVNSNSVYEETFNSLETGWLSAHSFDKGLPSGWKQQTVSGAFNKLPITEGMIWQTGDPADNIIDEHSWVESPYFNIDHLNFPILSLDIIQSLETSRDGAVLQYSLDNGTTWELLGDINQGVNWYNESGIVSNPGEQSGTGNVGWTWNTQKWETARFSLDMVKSEAIQSGANVRFRIAYSSDAGNVSGDFSGFAFDNFKLTSRKRVVLIEQFVNTAYDKAQQENEEAWLDLFTENNLEVVDMRYHNFIAHDYDPLFYINPPDISARSMEYGATMGQLTIVDGIGRFLAPAEMAAKESYEDRTLTENCFNIEVSTENTGDNLRITANITKVLDIAASTTGSKKSVVRMAIVQKEYTHNGEVFNNVIVELLPNGEGNVVASIPEDFPIGESMVAEGSWTPNVTTEGNKFRLVVYIQGIWGVDEIHQVWFADLDDANVPKVTVNSLTQELKTAASSKFNIYPTPVKEKLNINWYEALESPVHWRLISISGSVVKQGVTQSGQITEEIETYDIKEGFYLLCTEDKVNSIVEKRKIIIIK